MVKKMGILAIAAFISGILLATYGGAAIKGVYGFAVAQTSTKWHNVKDVSAGDNASNGAMLVAPCMWDGTNCDRQRGDVTNGLDVDVSRIASNDGTDIGDVTVNNASGASAINVQDGGNSLTTDVAVDELTSLNAVTTTGAGTSAALTVAASTHTYHVIVTGSPTSVNVDLEGSIDGVTWFVLDSSTTTTSEMRHVVNKLVENIRANLTTLTGGTSPTVTVEITSGGNS